MLVDVNHDFYFNNNYLEREARNKKKEIKRLKESSPGFYYLAANIKETVNKVGAQSLPQYIPVIDMVSGIGLFDEPDKNQYWQACHRKFVIGHPGAEGITAKNCHHYIWFDNPALLIVAASKMYAAIAGEPQKCQILQRLADVSLIETNQLMIKK